ncbi:hypothetical protein ACFLS9_07530 [Bacteroidota bacterium]
MSEVINSNIKFREVQLFRYKWLQISLILIAFCLIILFGHGMIKQLVYGHSWGDRPMGNTS